MDTITQLISISIVGSALSIVIQFIKTKWGIDSPTTKVMTIGLALALGLSYYFLVNTSFWLPIIGILGAASTFYAFFLKDTELGEKIKSAAL